MTTHDENTWSTAPPTNPPSEYTRTTPPSEYSRTTSPSEYTRTAPTLANEGLGHGTTGSQTDTMKDTAAQQGGELAGHAKDSAQQVASVAGDRAADVKDEAIAQTKQVYDQARSQLSDHATGQLQQVSAGLRDLADELHRMAGAGAGGVGTSLVTEAATRAHGAASFLEGRRVEDVLDDVRTFARRRPGAFLLGAAGLGLLAGRLARGAKDASATGPSTEPSTGTSSAIQLPDADPYPTSTRELPTTPPTLAETNLYPRGDAFGGEPL